MARFYFVHEGLSGVLQRYSRIFCRSCAKQIANSAQYSLAQEKAGELFGGLNMRMWPAPLSFKSAGSEVADCQGGCASDCSGDSVRNSSKPLAAVADCQGGCASDCSGDSMRSVATARTANARLSVLVPHH